MKYLILSCLFCMSILSGPVLALVSAPPERNAPALVIVAPWFDPAAIVAAAGGRIVGPVSAPMAVLAVGDDAAFTDRLAGVPGVLVRGGRRLASLCGVASW